MHHVYRIIRRKNLIQSAEFDTQFRQHVGSVYNNMAIGLLLSGAIAYLISENSMLSAFFFGSPQVFFWLLTPLLMTIIMGSLMHKLSAKALAVWYYAFASIMGIGMATIFAKFELGSIYSAFFVTSAVFGASSLYGYLTKRDLASVGYFFFMGLIGLVIASIVNLFIQSSMMLFITSCLTVVVFIGLTAYDTQKMKETFAKSMESDSEFKDKAVIFNAMSLYLNVVNLLLSFLQIFGVRK